MPASLLYIYLFRSHLLEYEGTVHWIATINTTTTIHCIIDHHLQFDTSRLLRAVTPFNFTPTYNWITVIRFAPTCFSMGELSRIDDTTIDRGIDNLLPLAWVWGNCPLIGGIRGMIRGLRGLAVDLIRVLPPPLLRNPRNYPLTLTLLLVLLLIWSADSLSIWSAFYPS